MAENFDQEMEAQVSFSDYLRILYRGRWIILISFIVVFTATLIFTVTTPPTYEASASILIESTGLMERSFFDMGAFGNQSTLVANQTEILKSRRLAEQVIKRLDMSDVRDSLQLFQPNEEGEYTSFRDMVDILRNSMEVTHTRDTDILTLTMSAGSAFEAAYITNVVAEEFQLINAESNKGEISDLRKFIEGRLAIKQKELRGSEDRLRAYQEKEKVASLDDETSELVTRLAEVESMLEQAQVELEANLEMKRSLEEKLEERKQMLPADLSEISTPYLESLQQQLAKLVGDRTVYVTALQADASIVNKSSYQATVVQYDQKIKALKDKLQQEAGKIAGSNMVSDPLKMSQDIVNKLLTIDGEIKASSAKISALQDVVGGYSSKLDNLPVKILELARLERRRKIDEQTYIMMVQKLEETKIQEAAQAKNVRIIDEAIEPLYPVKPKKKLNVLLGALIGLGLGVGVTFLMEYFDNTVKSPEELEKMGFNILSSIPRIEMEKVEKKLEKKSDKLGQFEGRRIEARLITHLDPKAPVSEAYRTLRTNLQFSKVDKDLQILLVTSSGPKEGKSTTAANLAIAMAQVGKKVLLVDADLRRPVIHSIFGLKKDEGMTNHLMGLIDFKDMLKPTFLDNLFLATSGALPPNPSELLASKKMEELLQKFRNEFDIVVIDSPPVIAVTDAVILSTKVDGTILVVSSGQTDKDALSRAHTLLDTVDSNLLGTLLNGVNVEGMYGSYYYYYYHHYYSKPGKKKKRRSKLFSA